jgi:SNF2 family DNA or RNA helicase
VNQELSPVRGGILANDCGLGKTVICYGLVLESYHQKLKMRQEAKAKGEECEETYKPTVVLCPSPLVNVHLSDLDRFGSKLIVKVFYGTELNTPPRRRKQLIKNTCDGLNTFIDGLDKEDPDVSTLLLCY